MATDQAILRLENLTVVYDTPAGPLYALDDVSLTLNRGGTHSIVGESGSGKSTLALAAMKAIHPQKGSVVFDGHDISPLKGKALASFRKRMQLVFQDPYSSLNPGMKVHDIIAEPLHAHRWGSRADIDDRIHSLMNKVGLPEDAGQRLPSQFSGGQRQRIAIARALALEPELLIADEPVSALDVSVQAQIVKLLKDIQQDQGVAYLIVAHDLALVHHISHRITVMYLGKIVEEGPADLLVAKPAHPYTASLLSATPIPRRKTEKHSMVLEGEPPSAIERPSGCAFHPRCPIARPQCKKSGPPLSIEKDGRKVACHFAGEIPSPIEFVE